VAIFISNKLKCFSFYLFSIIVCKIGVQEGGTSPSPRGRAGISGRGEVVGKGGKRVNTEQ
jgi:hypothetical protein